MKICLAVLAFAAVTATAASAQAAPAGSMSPTVGPGLPAIDGLFHYALSGAEQVETGYSGSGTGYSTSLSGDASYSSKSEARPFSMVYAGGVLLGNQYGRSATTFQNFAVSQGLVTGNWLFDVSDSVSYLPESPTTGLSGIPGLGDLGSQPLQGPSTGPAGGILTNNSTSISNGLTGSVERRLTSLTSISGNGSWTILRFPDQGGLDNTQYLGEVGLNHRIDARDTVSGNVSYSTFSYGSGINLTVQTRGINGVFQRVLSRTLNVTVSAGPQWISSSNSALIPSRVTVATDASLVYSKQFTNAGFSYVRGVNGGSGVQPGALSDTFTGSVARSYGRDWMASLTADYTRTSGLLQPSALVAAPGLGLALPYAGGSGNTAYGGVQVSRRLGNSFSGFASYNLQHQSIDSSLASQNAFSGLIQTFGIGITYSPRSTRLGQF
ncbi:hypothetical protein P8936_01255 [Edaphobacter paludis]|uniref:Uncharacterized protein n=1 Tax=Edaphobacter paludis TaxID=3035702 RepID=A0AAU7D954_9BACT